MAPLPDSVLTGPQAKHFALVYVVRLTVLYSLGYSKTIRTAHADLNFERYDSESISKGYLSSIGSNERWRPVWGDSGMIVEWIFQHAD